MSQSPVGRLEAIKEDGFIDFYELLEVEPDATITRIRTTINSLYNESQSNRDHRNLNRRREYQTLLQVLPQAREFLLEEKKRELYDAFRDQTQRGAASITFEDWVRSLQEEEEKAQGDRSAVLGIQADVNNPVQQPASDGVPRATVIKAPKKPTSRVVVGDESASKQVPSRKSLTGLLICIGVFALLSIVGYFITKDPSMAILIGSLGGIITWAVTRLGSKKRTAV